MAQCHFLKHTLKRMLRAACHSKSTHTEKQDHTALGETLNEKQGILKAQTLFLATNSNMCLRREKTPLVYLHPSMKQCYINPKF